MRSGKAIALSGALIWTLGYAEQAVVGGVSIDISEAPWQLALRAGSAGCGASWIGGRWALTAAHCVDQVNHANPGSSTSVTAGITRDREVSGAAKVLVRRIHSHPDYKTRNRDIALLELAADITAVKTRPIRVALPADTAAGLTAVGVMGRLSGWGLMGGNRGFPDSLQKLDAKVARSSFGNSPHVIYFAGKQGSVFQGSCSGDSGGPLAVRDAAGTGWILAGVVSSGIGECGENPGNYSRVSFHADWIRTTTGGAVAVHPAEHGLARHANAVRASATGSIRVERDAWLEVAILDLSGSRIGALSGRFAAGNHRVGRGAGKYILRWRELPDSNFER